MQSSFHQQALDAMGVPTESESMSTFRSLASTEAGAQWLQMAVDPMHDRSQNAVGLPDNIEGRSVVYNIVRKVRITPPAGTTAAGYNALVHFTGDLNNSKTVLANISNFDMPTQGGTSAIPLIGLPPRVDIGNGSFGGVTIHALPAGVVDDLWLLPPNALAAPFCTDNAQSFNQLSTLPQGGCRLVGGSIEVIDTSAELNKAGSLTCYRQQMPQRPACCVHSFDAVSGTTQLLQSAKVVTSPPKSSEIARSLPNAVTHEAKLGAYMPLLLNTDAQLCYPELTPFLLADGMDHPTPFVSRAHYPMGPILSSQSANCNWRLDSKCSPCGIFLDNLNEESSFDVVARFLVEVFPSSASIDLMALTSNSPITDDRALASYSRIMAELPIAVPVSWNGSGKFLRGILKIGKTLVKRVVKPALKAGLTALEATGPQGAAASQLIREVGKPAVKQLSKKINKSLKAT